MLCHLFCVLCFWYLSALEKLSKNNLPDLILDNLWYCKVTFFLTLFFLLRTPENLLIDFIFFDFFWLHLKKLFKGFFLIFSLIFRWIIMNTDFFWLDFFFDKYLSEISSSTLFFFGFFFHFIRKISSKSLICQKKCDFTVTWIFDYKYIFKYSAQKIKHKSFENEISTVWKMRISVS